MMAIRLPDIWKRGMSQLRTGTYALWLVYLDSRTPWYAKILIACVVGYVFRPVELIPNFIPIVRYLDDLILVPLALVLAIKAIQPAVFSDCHKKAHAAMAKKKPATGVATSISVFAGLLIVSFAILFTVRLMADWIEVMSWWLNRFVGIG